MKIELIQGYFFFFEAFICSIIHTKGETPKKVKGKNKNKVVRGSIKSVISKYKVQTTPDIETIRLMITVMRIPIFFFIGH